MKSVNHIKYRWFHLFHLWRRWMELSNTFFLSFELFSNINVLVFISVLNNFNHVWGSIGIFLISYSLLQTCSRYKYLKFYFINFHKAFGLSAELLILITYKSWSQTFFCRLFGSEILQVLWKKGFFFRS